MNAVTKKLFILLSMWVLFPFGGCKKSADDIQKEKCKGVICNNGGTCVNGECDCAEGFEGPECSDEKPPVKMYLNSVRITKMPATDNGASWDVGSWPDIMLIFHKSVPAHVLYGTPNIYDADPTKNHTFTPPVPVEIENPQDKHFLKLYDFDDDSDDYIDGTEFTPYVKGEKFPKTRIIHYNGAKVIFECSFTYVF